MHRAPALVGISGHFKGEVCPLHYGKTLTVGRSRKADFSLKRTEIYRAQTPEEHDKDESAKTVSSKHFQVTMFNLRSIEIKNLSPNRTRVDGKPVDAVVLDDVATKSHEIRFGLEEVMQLEMRMVEEDEAR